MSPEKEKEKRFLRLLVMAEALLYLLYMGMDFAGKEGSDLVKFAALFLLAASSLRCCGKYTRAALFLCIPADVLLLLNTNRSLYPAGLLIFFLVQAMLQTRIGGGRMHPQFFLMVLAWPLLLLLMKDLLTALALTYFLLFTVNLFMALFRVLHTPDALFEGEEGLLLFGLLLYYICDVFVGIWNTAGAPRGILSVARLAMWGFYLPGLLLIRLSDTGEEKSREQDGN